jgi:hypothetical protein
MMFYFTARSLTSRNVLFYSQKFDVLLPYVMMFYFIVRNLITCNDVLFYSQKFDVLLPSLTLNLTEDQILVLYNFLFHFPSPARTAWEAETTRDGGGGGAELSRPRLVGGMFNFACLNSATTKNV